MSNENLSRDDLMKMFAEMIKKFSDLPPNALYTGINHYDLLTLMMLLYAIMEKKETT